MKLTNMNSTTFSQLTDEELKNPTPTHLIFQASSF